MDLVLDVRRSGLDCSSPAGNEIIEKHDHGCQQQDMNQIPGHMEPEPCEPQDDQNDEHCPQHRRTSVDVFERNGWRTACPGYTLWCAMENRAERPTPPELGEDSALIRADGLWGKTTL